MELDLKREGPTMKTDIDFDLAFSFVQQFSTILPGEKFLIMRIMHKLKRDPGGCIEISAAALAEGTGTSVRTTQRHIAKLKEKGIIAVEKTYFNGRMIAPNRYSLPNWKIWVEESTNA